MTAMADQNGVVYVWKTSGTTTTYLGSVTLPSNTLVQRRPNRLPAVSHERKGRQLCGGG